MKTYRVTFDLVLDDDAGHPRKWLADAIWENLNPGEDIDNIEIVEQETAE